MASRSPVCGNAAHRALLTVLSLLALSPALVSALAGAATEYFYQAVYVSDDCGSNLWYTTAYMLDYCVRVPDAPDTSTYFTRTETTFSSYTCRSPDCSTGCSAPNILPISACFRTEGVNVSYTFAVVDAPPRPEADAFVQLVHTDAACADDLLPASSFAILNGCVAMSASESYLTLCNSTDFAYLRCSDGVCGSCEADWAEPVNGCAPTSFGTAVQNSFFKAVATSPL